VRATLRIAGPLAVATCLALPAAAHAVIVSSGGKRASVLPAGTSAGKALTRAPRVQGSGDLV
jgi:hypothetical protein